MDQPHEIHWRAAKRILNFVQGTRNHGIFYKAKSDLELIRLTDSDWEGDNIDQKSTLGCVFMLAEGPISWSSKKQSAIALSSIEAEYRGVVNAATQCLWLQGLLVSVVSNKNTQILSIVIIRVPFESAMIQFRDREPNTLISICATSYILCTVMAQFTYSYVHFQNK